MHVPRKTAVLCFVALCATGPGAHSTQEAEAAWSPFVLDWPLDRAAFLSELVVDPARGVAHAVWRQRRPDDPYRNVYASRYVPGSGWTAPQRVSDNTGRADPPLVEIDPATGTVWVGWNTYQGGGYYSSLVLDGEAWSAPVLLNKGTGGIVAIAVDSAAGAVHFFYSDSELPFRLAHAVLKEGVLSPPIDVGYTVRPGATVRDFDVTSNPVTGALHAAWVERSSRIGHELYATVHSNGSWETPRLVGGPSRNDYNLSHVRIRADPRMGKVLLVWFREKYPPSPHSVILFSRYLKNGTWTQPAPVASRVLPSRTVSRPSELRVDGHGDFLVAWHQWMPGNTYNNYYTRTFVGEADAWLPPVRASDDSGIISPNTGALVVEPTTGNAMLIWPQSGDRRYVYTTLYSSRLADLRAGAWAPQRRVRVSNMEIKNMQLGAFVDESTLTTLALWDESELLSYGNPYNPTFELRYFLRGGVLVEPLPREGRGESGVRRLHR